MGNYLEDLFAGPPNSPAPLAFPQLTTHRILSHEAIAQASIKPHDWHFIAPGQAPLLDGLRPVLAYASLLDYLQTRDASRAATGAPAHWEGTSVQLTAKVHHLWDSRWRGENQAVANPHMANVLGVCPLCGHPHCSQTHILCNCPGLFTERAGLAHDLALIMNRLRPGPGRSLGRAIHHLLFHHHHRNIAHRGQLWTGLWAPPTTLLTQRGTPHLTGHQHLDHHGRDNPLDPVQGARPGPGIAAHAPHHSTGCPRGDPGAPRNGHGPLPFGPAGTASTGVTLPPTQATSSRPSTSGTAPPRRCGPTCSPTPPLVLRPSLRPRPPLAVLEPPALHGLTWQARITDNASHQPQCPGGRLGRIPGLAEIHNVESLLVLIDTPLVA